jgi:U2-associated protein SR140
MSRRRRGFSREQPKSDEESRILWNSIQAEAEALADGNRLNVSDEKIKAFQSGRVTQANTRKGKKVSSEKKKRELANLEAAAVYADFVKSFEAEDTTSTGGFVRGGLIPGNTGTSSKPSTMTARDEDEPRRGLGGVFNLSSKKTSFVSAKKTTAFISAKKETKRPGSVLGTTNAFGLKLGTKKEKKKKSKEPKKKRGIELFMEEMKRDQAAGLNQHRDKKHKSDEDSGLLPMGMSMPGGHQQPDGKVGHHDTGDPNTTNIYVGNLSPGITEAVLITEFGQYGDIASVKIMWPRTEEEHRRQRNCGFVSFMRREDAEEAMLHIREKPIMGTIIRCGWGKTVSLPSAPLAYKLKPGEVWHPGKVVPVPQQPQAKDDPSKFIIPTGALRFEVKFPQDRTLRKLIDRLSVHVAKCGHIFEKCVMEREHGNPRFSFLFNASSPEHLYYRWKTYSLAQQDSVTTWRTSPFQMMISGPFWVPPSRGVDAQPPKDTYPPEQPPERSRDSRSDRRESDRERDERRERERRRRKEERAKLRTHDEDKLGMLLRNLTSERAKIREVMGFALDHAEEAKDVVEILTESLCIKETPIPKKLARLFAISDILYNSSAPVKNASAYRSFLQGSLKTIFQGLHETYAAIDGRITANAMKDKVQMVLRVWQAWSLFPEPFLTELETIFCGDAHQDPQPENTPKEPEAEVKGGAQALLGGGYDSDDEDVDGVPLDAPSLLKPTTSLVNEESDEEDLDGVPLNGTPLPSTLVPVGGGEDEEIDGVPLPLEAMVVGGGGLVADEDDDDIDGVPL